MSGSTSTRTGRKSQAPLSQLKETIESTINPPHYYNKESSRHTAITKQLAIFIGATNVPSPELIVMNSVNYFKKWIANIKYLIEKEFLKKISIRGNNSIVVWQSQ